MNPLEARLPLAANFSVDLSEHHSLLEIAIDQTLYVDGTSGGKVFDGLGGISAGGSSRLLYDYSEPARSDLLDYKNGNVTKMTLSGTRKFLATWKSALQTSSLSES